MKKTNKVKSIAVKTVKPKKAKETKATKPKVVKKALLRVVHKPAAPAKKEKPHAVTPVKKKIVPAVSEIKEPKPVAAVAMPKPVTPAPEVIKKEKVAPPVIHKKEEKPKEIQKEKPKIEPPLPPAAPLVEPLAGPALKILELNLPITVKDLAIKLQEKPSVLIKMLMGMGLMVGINQGLDEPTVTKICLKYGFQFQKAPTQEKVALEIHEQADKPESLKPRAPIVTFMGHVDHGKTSLLDAVRKTNVAESEHGGITQHIGAYKVTLPHGDITFLDTPGHEAFTAMRARGASITDIVVLVVAADDGIMPQTQEAIDHARAAGATIIVAINKIDKAGVDIDRVKKQLAELNLLAEDWGGKTITVPVSAKTGQGIDNLLEMIILEAQMLELKANPDRPAKGVVIEAKLSKGRGPVATLLVQNGTLHLNDVIVVGKFYGKIKAMQDALAHAVVKVSPSVPVEVSGLSGIPDVGEQFFVMDDEKLARTLTQSRQEEEKEQQFRDFKRISLEDIYSQIKAGKLKELKLIIKADVGGSLQAIRESLNKLSDPEVKLNIIHEGVGSINAADVILAVVSDALILGFNVNIEDGAKESIEKEGVDVRIYNIIYEIYNDIKAALEGILEPKIKKVFVGRAEVRKVFRLSRWGTVAGSYVTKGKITRGLVANLVRNGEIVFEGNLSSVKRFKDDVKEVAEGFECGISLGGHDDIKEGDIVEVFGIEKIARKL